MQLIHESVRFILVGSDHLHNFFCLKHLYSSIPGSIGFYLSSGFSVPGFSNFVCQVLVFQHSTYNICSLVFRCSSVLAFHHSGSQLLLALLD